MTVNKQPDSSMTNALKQFEATEANLTKAERLLSEAGKLIPEGNRLRWRVRLRRSLPLTKGDTASSPGHRWLEAKPGYVVTR